MIMFFGCFQNVNAGRLNTFVYFLNKILKKEERFVFQLLF